MRRAGIAEWLLKRAAGTERGTAIYGDLVEIAAARGKIWFWLAYARTLVALTWRTAAAVLAAVLSVKYLRRAAGTKLTTLAWGGPFIPYHDPRLAAGQVPYLAHYSWIVSLQIMFMLWIVLPYVALRFGVRSRLTYLAGILLLLSVPVYTFRPQVYQITGAACALVIVAALASSTWRRQMLFLLANVPIMLAVYMFSVHHAPRFLKHGPFPMSLFHMRIDDPLSIIVTAMIGPLLHRWIVENRRPGAPGQFAG